MDDSANPQAQDRKRKGPDETLEERGRVPGQNWQQQLKGRRHISVKARARAGQPTKEPQGARGPEPPLERAGRGVRAGATRRTVDERADDEDPSPEDRTNATKAEGREYDAAEDDSASTNEEAMARQQHAMRTADEREFDD